MEGQAGLSARACASGWRRPLSCLRCVDDRSLSRPTVSIDRLHDSSPSVTSGAQARADDVFRRAHLITVILRPRKSSTSLSQLSCAMWLLSATMARTSGMGTRESARLRAWDDRDVHRAGTGAAAATLPGRDDIDEPGRPDLPPSPPSLDTRSTLPCPQQLSHPLPATRTQLARTMSDTITLHSASAPRPLAPTTRLLSARPAADEINRRTWLPPCRAVKGPSELKLDIDISTDKTVLELKEAIAAKSDVEKERQRLIYSGACAVAVALPVPVEALRLASPRTGRSVALALTSPRTALGWLAGSRRQGSQGRADARRVQALGRPHRPHG